MRDHLVGLDAVILVKFRQQGQPVVPSAASYTLYDTTGVAIDTDVVIPVGATTTQASIIIEAQHNTIASGVRYEKRTLLIQYTYGGQQLTQRVTYRVIPYLNHGVEQDAVRRYIGCNPEELEDDEIDLVRAYFEIEDLLGKTVLDAALIAGDIKELAINNALIYQAALNVIPSLQLRVAQERRDGPLGFSRFVVRDFSNLIRQTQENLTAALNVASNRVEAASSLAVLSNPTDPITGA